MEKVMFNQEVLIKTLIKAPISKSKVPIIIISEIDFFFSEISLKKIVDISISKKKTQTNRICSIVIAS